MSGQRRFFHVVYTIGGMTGAIDMRSGGEEISPGVRDVWRRMIEERHPNQGPAIILNWVEFESGEGF